MRPPEAEFDELTAEDVSRHFGRRRALSRVSFRANRGAVLGLLGPNGAGKSTMLALLGTLLRPSTGRILYGKYDASHHGVSLRASIGVLGHDLFLYPELTARENLEFFAGLYGVRDCRGAAAAALEHAGLADRADDVVTSFSRGMRQRLGLERALIHRPRLLLLDEPFTGLDDASAAALGQRLGTLRDQGTIIILATHDLDLAEPLLNRAIFLRDGRVVDAVERPEALRAVYREVMSRTTAVSGLTGSPRNREARDRTDEP
ncbi:MAG TPA: ABC transporter ATP-binding protein [Thermoanaerobaculia bacterium]|nr:ABC transporter ATP-binding protein [Thermoanaerobaculia bacterium]